MKTINSEAMLPIFMPFSELKLKHFSSQRSQFAIHFPWVCQSNTHWHMFSCTHLAYTHTLLCKISNTNTSKVPSKTAPKVRFSQDWRCQLCSEAIGRRSTRMLFRFNINRQGFSWSFRTNISLAAFLELSQSKDPES